MVFRNARRVNGRPIHCYNPVPCSRIVPLSISGGMSTKHIRTTADLVRFGAGLKIECGACGAARTVGGYGAAKLGGVQSLGAFARRLKCARCGAKEARLAILPPV